MMADNSSSRVKGCNELKLAIVSLKRVHAICVVIF